MPAVARGERDEVAAALGGQQRERVGERRAGRGRSPRAAGAAELARGAQRGERVRLAQREAQLGAEAVAAHRRRVGRVRPARAVRGSTVEAQARGVAGDAPQRASGRRRRSASWRTRRTPASRSSTAPGDRAQRAVEAERDRVDRHVAAAEVLLERARARPRAARPGAGSARARARARSNAQSPNSTRAVPKRSCAVDRRRRAARRAASSVALDDEVELARAAAEQQVADGAADDVDAVARRERAQQPARRTAGRAARRWPPGSCARGNSGRYPRRHVLEPPRPRSAALGRARGRAPPRRRGRRRRGGAHAAQPGDVSNPDVEFTQEQQPPTVPPTTPKDGAHPIDDGFAWPVYGYTKQRTPLAPAQRGRCGPPFVPAMGADGQRAPRVPAGPVRPLALPAQEQRRAVRDLARDAAACAGSASSATSRRPRRRAPTGRVYAVLLARGKGIKGGRVVAVDATNGRDPLVAASCPSRVESSPLLDSRPPVLRLRGRHGLRAAGERRRGALALPGERRGQGRPRADRTASSSSATTAARSRRSASATAARCGRRRAPARAFGLRAGQLLLDAGGRLRARLHRQPDGFVYSFAASNGKLAWRHKTGDYVYSSPAVGQSAGAPGRRSTSAPTTASFYALDARSPASVRWARNVGRQDLRRPGRHRRPRLLLEPRAGARRRPSAPRTGQTVWKTGRGAFNPVISDGRRIYLVGYSSLFSLADRAQARRDARVRLRDPVERRRARNRTKARAENRRARVVGRRVARRKRVLARRVAARKRAVARNRRLRREHREVCFRSNGRTVCRVAAQARVLHAERRRPRRCCRPRRP